MKMIYFAPLALAASAAVFSSQALAADFLNADTSAPQLSKVAEAYLAGDAHRMAAEIKSALMAQPGDQVVLDNALGYLKKAYQLSGHDGIAADWHLPEEITKMKVTVRVYQKDIPQYQLKVYGNLTATGLIKQLKVTRYPDQVVLDKLAKIGNFDDSADAIGKDPEYNYETKRSRQQVAAGLYLLHLELTTGSTTDGWFFVDDDMNATATPTIAAPADGETYATGTPTFHWANFVSPQYKPYENRSVWMEVAEVEAPAYSWNTKWELWQGSPTIESVTLGSAESEQGARRLEDGKYVFLIDYHERHRFGDLMVGRDCSSSRPFVVRQ